MKYSEKLLFDFEFFLKTRGHSVKTIHDYTEDIKGYLRFCTLRGHDEENSWSEKVYVVRYLSHLSLKKTPLKASSIARKRAALIELSSYHERNTGTPIFQKKTIKSPKVGYRLPEYYKTEEIQEILQCFSQDDLWELRDLCLLLFLFGTGLRANELLNIKIDQISSTGEIRAVIGKGGKVRSVFLPNLANKIFRIYGERFQSDIRETKNLFFNRKRKSLSYSGLYYIITNIYKRYPHLKQNKHLHPHGFRHSFATALLSEGVSIRSIADLLGHTSLNTTQKYAHVDGNLLRKTMSSFHPHFR